jgi:hypothetical protein
MTTTGRYRLYMYVPYDELPEQAKDLVFEMQKHQKLIIELGAG